MINIAVFASGKGSNFSAIARALKKGKIRARLALLVCDQPQAPVLLKAKRTPRVKIALVERKDFPSKEDFESRIIRHLKENNIDLIVMAGYMRILSLKFTRQYRRRILNIHPALLPAFKGSHGIRDAFSYGVKVTGVTVHFVDEEMDHGPIILQEAVEIKGKDTRESLERRTHAVEHKLYPEAIRLYAEGRLKVQGRRVRVSSRKALSR